MHQSAARFAAIFLCIASLVGVQVEAQVLQLAELNTEEIADLDRDRTVVLIPAGVLEEHGPFLPSFTDGYQNEAWARDIADAIVARPGWTVLMFPMIPLGTGGANDLALKPIFPGSYGVRAATLRAIFMDLATRLGEQSIRWVFIVHNHGSPDHNQALDDAADYFTEEFGGRMVNLTGLLPTEEMELPPAPQLTEAEQLENGYDIHAGMSETSRMLFLRPDLVDPGYTRAVPRPGTGFRGLTEVGQTPNWPGYFGSPRLATAARGAQIYGRRLARYVEFALRVLDGWDPSQAPRLAEVSRRDPGWAVVDSVFAEYERRIAARQERWLRERNRR